MKRTLTFCASVAVAVVVTVFVATTALASGPLTVDIHGPGQRMVNIILLPPKGLGGSQLPTAQAKAFEELVVNNLNYIPFLKLIPTSELLGGDPSRGVGGGDIDFKPMQMARIDLCMTTGWNGRYLEARVFETFGGRRVVGKSYNDVGEITLAQAADRFCSAFLEALTGKKGFFDSPVAFVRQDGKAKEIYTVLPQGRELKRITNLGGYNLSPSWSADGSKIIFTHIASTRHELGVYDSKTQKITLYSQGLGQTIISPVFGPGDKPIVALNVNGATDIQELDASFKPQRVLARSPYIDVSPSFDRTGTKMAFTSGRAGNPHVYLMDMKSGEVRRVTMTGKYNTHPCLSPDGRYIAYTNRTGSGHRIFLHDLATGREKQLTFGPGNDEYPAFDPDGYFVAFASNRSGGFKLYLTTRHGDTPRVISTGPGQAFAPAWDTALQW
ncbi:MAG: PD40 domain-containing protein [Pseudodesulfovibrio sp.]|uniref:WD40-like beta Propeller containing protein n=1 Tax=Pseudodesulfovibrio aespoeensis (strain ATCC 700646 / DSM 10631 / Aspo-2) TaxID=643562 RepID=E6VVZ0_PSEA9|nr:MULTISPECIES: PD40 domain-containing protein [Pseudodesulfovibrio]MBU4244158.1 protein tolB [Pseudomonadota bacterium]ADU62435.1 WD40-like beta Propeller containing protein [Pseudodesulfovibrio aespoeensis Aspo-2]MBU4473900.1 protein tolB [Pseudomonadota bacterium]MBU4515098.1 protein tolB [Pseudomonadota bacterium]MBU4521003.1 protein tolB [Pseudomonadota bacterium]